MAVMQVALVLGLGIPTVALEVFRRARDRGLYKTYVTNGYMTPEALHLPVEVGLDAMNMEASRGM